MIKSESPMDRWIDELLGRPQPFLPPTPALEPTPTPSETRAERTEHAARQILKAEKEQRQAHGARLRQARLEKEAQDKASRGSTNPSQLGEKD